jgi:2,4-dienoyl-CoA reductase-like NADH-dependent reductase (Old Yellow Enzyme family)
MQSRRLFEPYGIGSLKLKDRMIIPLCSIDLGKDGFVTERMKTTIRR